VCAPSIDAIVVPHDPAPITATEGCGRTAVAYGADVDAPVAVVMTRIGVVVPIRAFALGKARLAERLDRHQRAALALRLAESVVDAAEELTVLIVSSDDDVREWTHARSLPVIDDPGSLDGAATTGRAWLAARGYGRVVVAHADLPHARSLSRIARDGSRPIVTLVPCHRDDGTPVLSLPAASEFRFSYGPGSFRRHAAEARRCGLALRVVRDVELGFDVDTVADLERLDAGPPHTGRAR
jgi:2-phospho-L-lactate guanylyltransferase